jgi:transposase-like protein
MGETRRKFDQDFKEGAVRLARETGRPIAQVAKDLGINEGTLAYALTGRDEHTIKMYQTYAETHIIPALGKRPLHELTVDEVEKFLARKSPVLSSRSLRILHSILQRAIRKAQARGKVRHNIILLCDVPEGRVGRPSKSLTLTQAELVLKAADRAQLDTGLHRRIPADWSSDRGNARAPVAWCGPG